MIIPERNPIAFITCPRCRVAAGIVDTYLLEEDFEWVICERDREAVMAQCDEIMAVRALLMQPGRGICSSMRNAVTEWLFKAPGLDPS
jgi:hypothetical protein